jgi:hypothetical protein
MDTMLHGMCGMRKGFTVFLLFFLIYLQYEVNQRQYGMDYSEFKEKLKECDLTVREFCNESQAGYGGIINCSSTKREMPLWIESWLRNYSEAQSYRALQKALQLK